VKGRCVEKIPGGKLLRVEVEVEVGILRRVLVRGDFFAHPEELFEAAEQALSGIPVVEAPEMALEKFSRRGLSLFGATPRDICEAIRKAIDAAQAT